MSTWRSTVNPESFSILQTFPVRFYDRAKFAEAHEFILANGIVCTVGLAGMVFEFQCREDMDMLNRLTNDLALRRVGN